MQRKDTSTRKGKKERKYKAEDGHIHQKMCSAKELHVYGSMCQDASAVLSGVKS